jgi:hypothetical protein
MPNPPTMNFQTFLKGYYKTMNPNWMHQYPVDELLSKADTIFGPTGTAAWYDPVYSRDLMLESLTRDNTIFSLLQKTTFQQQGDSFKYIATDSATGFKDGIGEAGVIVNGTSSVPTPTDVDNIFPAVVELDWLDTEVGLALSAIQNEPVNNPEQIREYMGNYFIDKIEQALAGVAISSTVHGVDTPAVDGGTSKAAVECIDRMITDQTESGATNHVSAAGDGDIFWNEAGSGTARIDRSASAAWDAQIKLPTAAGTEENYDILSELDDLMAVAKKYRNGTGTPNYIGLCSDKAMNKIQNELDPKGRYLEGEISATKTLNGVTTRPGVEGGKIGVAGLQVCGVKIPFFQAKYLDGTAASSWVWANSVYSGGVGNIYLMNLDGFEFRTLIPITYKKVPNTTNNSAPGLGNINVLYMAGQLLCRQWASHAALKYIAS